MSAAPVGRPPSCICGKCAKCKRAAYMRQWWANLTPEQKREKVARRDPDRVRAADARKMAKRRATRPDYLVKQAARMATKKLAREPCLFCDDPQVQAHHHDYSKPLDVTWLCRRHHDMVHRDHGFADVEAA